MSWKRLKDEKLQERLKVRARIVQAIREFFIKEGFLEVETPILVPAAGQEPYLDPMRVEFTTPNPACPAGRPSSIRRGNETISSPFEGEVRRGFLITSPEYAHKKLLAAGFEKTFEITRAFRAGEQWGGLHNPEFTMIEWYRARADYTVIMQDVEALIQYVWHDIRSVPHGKSEIRNPAPKAHPPREEKSEINPKSKYPIPNLEYQGKVIDLSSPWERLTVAEAFQKYANVNLDEVPDEETFFKIFLTKIERKLGIKKPTILYEYPASMASLARLKPSPDLRPPSPLGRGIGGEGRVAERFEVYIAGIELGNAFSELNDSKEQRRRFIEEGALRKKLGKESIPLDDDFIDAVGNMPLSAGIAFGIDRLVMLLTNAATIENVLAFPAGELFANA